MIKAIPRSIDKFLTSMLGDLTPTGMAWARVGLCVMVAAAAMSCDFGWQISWMHGVFLGCLTFVTAFGPEAAYTAIEDKKYVAGTAIAIICIPLLSIEFYSHGGYTAGLRGQNMDTARVQNTKYEDAQESSKEEKTNLEMWKKQLAELTSQNAWATSVKADALRDQLKTLKDRMAQEEKGGRGRKAGRGQEFERLQDAANALEAKIGTIEQAADLTRRIDATQRLIDKKRETAASTEFRSSAVMHQNATLAKWVSLVGFGQIKPTAMVEATAEESATFMMAIAGTGLPAFALFIAVLYRRQRPAIGRSGSPLLASSDGHIVHHDYHVSDVFGKMQAAIMAERYGKTA